MTGSTQTAEPTAPVQDDLDELLRELDRPTWARRAKAHWRRILRAPTAIWWWFQHRLNPRHRYHVVKTGLKPGYYDADQLVLWACFSLLERVVEHEKIFEHIAFSPETPEERAQNPEWWAQQELAGKELKRLYEWWQRYKNTDPDWMWDSGLGFSAETSMKFERLLELRTQHSLESLIKLRHHL